MDKLMTTAGEQLRLDGQDAALAAATVGHHDHPNRIEAWMTDHYNVLPALIGHHARRGHIHHVGWCSPTRRTRHNNPNRTWKGPA